MTQTFGSMTSCSTTLSDDAIVETEAGRLGDRRRRRVTELKSMNC